VTPPGSEPATSRAWLRSTLVLAAGAFLLLNCLYYRPYIGDDAFISFRYAAHLVAGDGLVYNVGERVEGYSNFLWVLIAAAFMQCGLPLLASIKALGVLSALATAVLSGLLGRRLLGPWPGAFVFVVVAAQTSLAVWSQAGLETTFFGFLLVASCLSFERELERSAGPRWSALLFGLAWLTRPEAPAYLLYFVARRLAQRPRRCGRRDVLWCVVLGAIVLPYEVWGLWYYGALFPHTHAVKAGGELKLFSAALERAILFKYFAQQGIGFAVLSTAGLIGTLLGLRRCPSAAWAPALAGLTFMAYAWVDWMPRHRLLVPALPFLALATVYGVAELQRVLGRTPRLRLALAFVWLLAALHAFVHQATGAYEYGRGALSPPTRFAAAARGNWLTELGPNFERTLWPLESDAWLILNSTPSGEFVAVGDIGFPGFVSMNPIWDLRGLVTPAAALSRAGGKQARQAAIESLLAKRPGLILMPAVSGKAIGLMNSFDKRLQRDARISAGYVRELLPQRIIYRRNDLVTGDVNARVERALQRLPSFRASVMERPR